tara:strand:- start:3046 stop:3285 length:240 start_codon:yes stop_codon:yes gene_type:complete
MKIQAQEVKEGQEVFFGWGEWLKVEKIEKKFQKNGKELTHFIGSTKQELTTKTKRKYPVKESQENHTEVFKSLTKVTVR